VPPRPRVRRLTESELLGRVRRGLHAELALFSTSPGGRLARWPGVLASVCPVAPERSLLNGVALELGAGASALEAVYGDVRRTYADAGVRAFTVWVEPGDATTAAMVAARGHVVDSRPVAMAARIDTIAPPPIGELDWRETRDGALIGRINDAAYGFSPPALAAAMAELPAPWYGYVARHDGDDVACLICHESDDRDCGVAAVATVPGAQGRGIATRLLTVALATARRRGCVTTSLQASPSGRAVYARLGYRDLGSYQMWERREARDE
jgi:GNAT superfamily N-acetyltransferase